MSTIEASVYRDAKSFNRHLCKTQFDECCIKAVNALRENPYGLSLQQVQTSAGLSLKTTKLVLAQVAIELKGRYYPKVGK